MDAARRRALEDLVEFRGPIGIIANRLRAFPWARPDDEQVILTRDRAVQVLDRVLSGQLSIEDLHQWADTIEVREDIDYEEPYSETLRRLIFELANPKLQGDVSSDSIGQMVAELRR
jgi:hypothetical protein